MEFDVAKWVSDNGLSLHWYSSLFLWMDVMALTLQQEELIRRHLELVIKQNETLNLTRVSSYDAGKILHIEDSLAGIPELLDAPQGSYADLGSGGGFPGITLSIATGRPVLLVDSVAKKMAAIEKIVSELGLDDSVSTYAGRIEDLSLEKPGTFAVLTARALTSLPSLIELASPLLMSSGQIICYKSKQFEEELSWAKAIEKKVGMRHISTRELELSDGTPRAIIVFEKTGDSLVKLPRRPGMAQKRPYKK